MAVFRVDWSDDLLNLTSGFVGINTQKAAKTQKNLKQKDDIKHQVKINCWLGK